MSITAMHFHQLSDISRDIPVLSLELFPAAANNTSSGYPSSIFQKSHPSVKFNKISRNEKDLAILDICVPYAFVVRIARVYDASCYEFPINSGLIDINWAKIRFLLAL